MNQRRLAAIKQISKEIVKGWDNSEVPVLIEIKQTKENYQLVYEASLVVENLLGLELDCITPTFDGFRGYLIWFDEANKGLK
jgi:hypothetical protein